jgi:hypothetical protein
MMQVSVQEIDANIFSESPTAKFHFSSVGERLTLEMTWGETATTQAKGSGRHF